MTANISDAEVFYEWTIEKFSSLTESVDLPSFPSTDAHSWTLKLCLRKVEKSPSKIYIELFLYPYGKLKSNILLDFELHFRTKNETLTKCISYEFKEATPYGRGIRGMHLAAPDPDDKLFVGCRIKSSHDRRYFLPPTIVAALSSQCNNHRTADVEFRVGPEAKSLYGHRGCLAARSRYFAAMFDSGLRESNDDGSRTVIDVPDIEHPVFEALLQYIYLDQTEFDNGVRMPDLLLAADKYDVLELTKIVWGQVADTLTPGRVCQLLMTHGHIQSIKKNMITYLVNQFNEVEKTEEFKQLLEDADSSLIHEIMKALKEM